MSDKKLLFKAVFFSCLCGILVSIILLCIFSVIIMTTGLLPTNITNYITIAILSMGSFIGGYICAKITKSAALICGLLTGFAIFILIALCGLFYSNEAVTILTLIKLISTLLCGSLGGIVTLLKKERILIK